jgi:putative serine protease PepD
MKTRTRAWHRYLLPVAAAVAAALAITSFVLALTDSDAHGTRVVERTRVVPSSTSGGLNTRAIYAKDAPGVAFVQSSGITTDSPFRRERGVATGSGFVVDRRGDILTNAHVVDGARKVTVRFGGSGSEVPAQVVGTDNSNDLAVLRVDPSRVKLHPLSLAGSSSVHVGDPVAAIGNPFGFDRTITAGIVSALQRQITAPDGFTIDHVIQTDAPINPGNSGGPLIDARGQVVGINSQIATGGNGDANVGIGFAIPITTAKRELGELERGGTVQHAFLGVGTVPGNGGVLVKQVQRGSPAAKAGLRSGDLIVSLAGRPVRDPAALATAVGAHQPGQTVTVDYLRHGARRTASATLARHPTTVLPSSGLGG